MKLRLGAGNTMLDFSKSALEVAPQLLGCKLLVIDEKNQTAGGIIVETEAYVMGDEANHAFGGQTKRNAVMFRKASAIYVYAMYGRHVCLNIVTGREGEGEAVLVRALQPTAGLALMWQRRFGEPFPEPVPHKRLMQLTNGPAKVTQALGVTLHDNGAVLNHGRWRLKQAQGGFDVVETTRIGITKASNKPWRWYIAQNRFISRR